MIWHAHPNYRGEGPWKDWAIVDWGPKWGKVPCKIWCFVELSQIPQAKGLEFGGIKLKDGTYAVVEAGEYVEDDDAYESDLFLPVDLEYEDIEDDDDDEEEEEKFKRVFYLADVEAFVSPCIVIPDIGGPFNRCFHVKSRQQWKDSFVDWLKQPHKLDETLEETEEEVVKPKKKTRKKKN